jgi:pyruvate/2-oxoacid:ferredoxin oxidoreductase alpha subunit
MFVFESGNVAAATGVKLARAQVIAAYPITPQTPLTEKLSVFVDEGKLDARWPSASVRRAPARGPSPPPRPTACST